MARGRGRWENRDLRHTFPLPAERDAQPRFDGRYGKDAATDLRFASDGTLRWDGETGEWRMHGLVLYVTVTGRACEGAVDGGAVYLLCTDGEGRGGRTQHVLAFGQDA